jgi:hypothetical protein
MRRERNIGPVYIAADRHHEEPRAKEQNSKLAPETRKTDHHPVPRLPEIAKIVLCGNRRARLVPTPALARLAAHSGSSETTVN